MSENHRDAPKLFFVVADEITEDHLSENNWVQPCIEGYALLNQDFKKDYPRILEYFSRAHIKVIFQSEDEPSLLKIGRQFIVFDATLKTITECLSSPVFFNVSIGLNCRPDEEHNSVRLKNQFEYPFNCYERFFVFSFGAVGENILEVIGKLVHCAITRDSALSNEKILHFAGDEDKGTFVICPLGWNAPVKTEQTLKWSSLLTKAVEDGLLHIADLFVERGTLTRCSFTATSVLSYLFFFAVDHNQVEILKLLLNIVTKYNINNNHNIDVLLRQAVLASSPGVVELILGLCPSVSNEFNTNTFHLAFRRNNFMAGMSCFDKMKTYGFRIDFNIERSSFLLFSAIVNNWSDVVRRLLENGADVNEIYEFDGLLSDHTDYEDVSFFRRGFPYKDNRLRIDWARCKTWTPLHMSARHAEKAVTELLLKHGADINAELEDRTPIYEAIDSYADRRYAIDNVKLLIASGANVRHNSGLISLAIENGDPAIVELLLLKRTPVSMEESELQKLLALAFGNKGPMEVMGILFKFGAQLNAEILIECIKKWNYFEGSHTLQALLDNCFTTVDFMDVTTIIRFDSETTDPEVPTVDGPQYGCCYISMKPCFSILARHVVKREAAKLSLPEQNVSSFWHSADSVNEFRIKCEAEIEIMTCERVGDSDATFYDLFTKDINQLARYAKHKDFLEVEKKGDYWIKFPIYASVLSRQFAKGAHRKELLDSGVKICSLLSVTFHELPDIVKEKIIKYLNNYNLEVLKCEFDQYVANTAD